VPRQAPRQPAKTTLRGLPRRWDQCRRKRTRAPRGQCRARHPGSWQKPRCAACRADEISAGV